jgi:hypothetical protein
VSGDDQVSTFHGCALIFLLWIVCCILAGAVIGLVVAAVAWLLGWL